ncbi:ATP-dependent DNA helicase [Metabacillus sediminilitoris]|uniref:ATP-dependent DNA helicase n=1 Tax=Metabacillus sediminilitoris TaxID=2567941 RepID=A0A4S4C4U9_9BACI|nr:ATP-dependent DNA helicase [Metabacillus sediminilitoris]QGQ46636.1 ATP-dependent DNA helicase [Metabacillus sediminilitoris]THF82786.1 ATP-dependent DNA helicase [Metabacillus sediminilitoris]
MVTARLPFTISKDESFYQALNNWIGDVFYDILPEKGFEERDEQIFMAFQLERAYQEKKVMFAEAGVGTGKTIVYLLYALSYARYTGKPAIIACADETLIEQLVKQEGDIAKLSKYLDLQMDVRLSKSHSQYLCLNKLDEAIQKTGDEKYLDLYQTLPDFVHEKAGMQQFSAYGDRKEFGHLNDEEWNKIGWDTFQDCFTCSQRHRCGLTLSRDYYRKATDIIVCSHDYFMEHVWTYDSRKREGQMPLLPEYSSVVFDEGHLLEFAAQKALTYRVKQSSLQVFLERLLQNEIREELAYLVEDALAINDEFFDELQECTTQVEGSNRLRIHSKTRLQSTAKLLQRKLSEISEALVFEGELFTIGDYELKIVEEYIDQMEYSLSLFNQKNNAVSWVEVKNDDYSLVIMPRKVEEVLKESVFSKKIPFIFSSATLSEGKSFDFIAKSLGISDYLSLSVDSPFDYEEQMKISLINEEEEMKKFSKTLEELKRTGGRGLILFTSQHELKWFKENLASVSLDFPVLFEGDKEISSLVKEFQQNEETVLCAVHLWEGLDIPGPSLSNVIIWSLPYPPEDPVFEAKKSDKKDPFTEVELPYMLLRLRQGIGRLIRTSQDSGSITIFLAEKDQEIIAKIKLVLPIEPVVE